MIFNTMECITTIIGGNKSSLLAKFRLRQFCLSLNSYPMLHIQENIKYILQRIEKVKELISYCELSLEEIAQQVHYKDVSHMSKQFKKTVGITPSIYRKNQRFERKFLDHIIT